MLEVAEGPQLFTQFLMHIYIGGTLEGFQKGADIGMGPREGPHPQLLYLICFVRSCRLERIE